MEKKLLIVSYYYPPYWTTGVIRIAKTTKYLARLGWRITVLTPRRHYVPREILTGENYDGCAEIRRIPLALPDFYQAMLRRVRPRPAEAAKIADLAITPAPPTTVKTHTFKTIYKPSLKKRLESFLFPIDVYILWLPWACLSGALYLRRHRDVRLIWISGPPFSQLLVGVFLRRLFRSVRFVADFRDHWVEDMNRLYPTPAHRWIESLAERAIFSSADLLVFVSEIHRDLCLEKGPWGAKARFLPNGFDEEDFGPPETFAKTPIFELAYFGNIGEGRNIAHLIDALHQQIALGTIARSKIRCVLYGNTHAYFRDLVARQGLSDVVRFEKPLPYRDALARMRQSGALLLVIDNDPYTSCYPTKFFEYLYARRPILSLGPIRGAGQIVQNERIGLAVSDDDPHAIGEALVRLYRLYHEENAPLPEMDLNPYRRESQARVLSAMLEAL